MILKLKELICFFSVVCSGPSLPLTANNIPGDDWGAAFVAEDGTYMAVRGPLYATTYTTPCSAAFASDDNSGIDVDGTPDYNVIITVSSAAPHTCGTFVCNSAAGPLPPLIAPVRREDNQWIVSVSCTGATVVPDRGYTVGCPGGAEPVAEVHHFGDGWQVRSRCPKECVKGSADCEPVS